MSVGKPNECGSIRWEKDFFIQHGYDLSFAMLIPKVFPPKCGYKIYIVGVKTAIRNFHSVNPFTVFITADTVSAKNYP